MPNHAEDADTAAIAQLAARGVDLSQPLLIEFAVEAPDGPSAKTIEAALASHGYQARVEYDEGEPDENGVVDPDDEEFGPSWTVYVDIRMVPQHAEILRAQADLDRIASPLGGRADGWGATLDV